MEVKSFDQYLPEKGFLPERSEVVLRHILEKHAARQPERNCIIFEDDEVWTYEQALKEAYGATNVLSALGIRRGENVLLFLGNGPGYIRAWCGITFLGGVAALINTAYKGEMLKHVCKDTQARHIITTPELADRLKGLDLDLNVIDPDMLRDGPHGEPKLDRPIEPWDIHTLMYTSGTTGPSKGVLNPYFQVYMKAQWYWTRATRDDTMLVVNPLFHTTGTDAAYGIWIVGGCTALQPVFSGSRFWDWVRKYRATFTILVGTTGEFLASQPPQPNDAVNPLKGAVVVPMVSDPEAFMARFSIQELYVLYGSTETGIVVTDGPRIKKPKSCGKVSPLYQVRLVDDHDIPVPTGEAGELIVRGQYPWLMMAGYWNRPQETAYAMRNGWFHTGDMLRCDEEGYYFWADRKKDAIRRRGENISSFEVEREVLAYPGVLEAACVAVPAKFGEDDVKVFLVVREPEQFNSTEFIEFLARRMPYFMVPRFVELIPRMPKTLSDKVKKYALRDQGNSMNTWDREAAGIEVKKTG